MKKLLTLIIAMATMVSFAQTKKKPTSKITETQRIKVNALNWFKNVYVETYFKDPYSYKVLKCEIYPITNLEALEDAIVSADREVSNLDTSSNHSDYATKRRLYYAQVNKLKRYPTIYKQSDVDRAKKDLDEELIKYNDAVNHKKDCEKLLAECNIAIKNKIAHYAVYIDCYSNNSYGNPVLGKYSLLFGKNGIVRDPIKLNND